MKVRILSLVLTVALCTMPLVACGKITETATSDDLYEESEYAETDEDTIVVGFSQIGAESDWRKANTESMKETFANAEGYELIIDDAQQKQSNQITAIRRFIQQEVDYIVLAPVTEDGWDTVLGEARDAHIPVIIVDRMVDANNSLFTCWVGSDFLLESKKVTAWMNKYFETQGIDGSEINIANIQGTYGASSQIGRTSGLSQAVRDNGWNFLGAECGEYTQAKGREVMSQFLGKYKDINVVYCENDNEAFGAIEAIEAAGRTVGNNIKDGEIMIVSFDGVSDEAMDKASEGKIACIGECNPLHGPRVLEIIKNLETGITPNKFEYVNESIYSGEDLITTISVDGQPYYVTVLNE